MYPYSYRHCDIRPHRALSMYAFLSGDSGATVSSFCTVKTGGLLAAVGHRLHHKLAHSIMISLAF